MLLLISSLPSHPRCRRIKKDGPGYYTNGSVTEFEYWDNGKKVSAEELNQKQAAIIEDEFTSLLEQNVTAIEAVAASPSTRNFIEGEVDASDFQYIDKALEDSNSTVVSGSDGMQLVRSKGDCVDVSSRDYFIEAIQGHMYISDVIVSKTTGSRIIVPAVPVYDKSGEKVIGIVQRNYDISMLHDFLQSEATDGLKIFICDRNGIVIAHSDHAITAEDADDSDDTKTIEDEESAKAASAAFGNTIPVVIGLICLVVIVVAVMYLGIKRKKETINRN